MDNFIFFLITLFYFYNQISCYIYEVKSLNYLRKKLRYLNDNFSFLQDIKGDSNYINYYYTTLYLGKDKTPQTYILDTGSSITTSPCDKCTSCGNHLNEKYKLENESNIISCYSKECNLASKSICKSGKCSFSISYAEGSKIAGFYINEEVFFEMINNEENNLTNISYKIPIGCTTKETHLFQTQLADGIMGLNNNDKSFVSMLYNIKVIQKNIFTLCFSHEGGYFSIGKIFSLHHLTKNITYINMLKKNNGVNHYMQLEEIIIGKKIIKSKMDSFIDSGTTLTYFPAILYNQIMKNFLEICKNNPKCGNLRVIEGFGYCTKLKSEEEIDSIINEGWINITFVLDGKEIVWIPQNYHFIYNTDKNGLNLCLGFDKENSRHNVLLGTTFMHGFDIIFDREENRMGFVPADCNRNFTNEAIKNNNNDINNIETNIDEDNIIKINKDNKVNIIQTNNSSDYTDIQINNTINKDINENIIINQTDKIIDIKIGDINNISEKINTTLINITDKINFTKINDIKLPNNLKAYNNSQNNSKSESEKNLDNNINEKSIIEERITFDKFMVKFSMFLACLVFIIFLIFNIILCRENYIYIQNKKNYKNINQNETEIANEDFNTLSIFNDSI